MNRDDIIQDAAIGWYHHHQGQYLSTDRSRMVDQCAQVLQTRFELSRDCAYRVAIGTLGSMESRRGGAFIDLAQSTSHVAYLRIPNHGTVYAFTAQHLQELALQHAGKCPRRETMVHPITNNGHVVTP